MKIVVNKKILDEFVALKINEERSFHSKNVNELEKQQPPIFPQQQTTQQLSSEAVPVSDPEFKPVTQKELQQASQQIASKIDSDKVQDFYTTLKTVAKKYSTNTDPLFEARKAINKMLKEADDADDNFELTDRDEKHLTSPITRAVDSILSWFSSLKKEERQAYTMKPSGDEIAIDSQGYKADLKIPRDAKEIVDGLLANARVRSIMFNEGITTSADVSQVRSHLMQHFSETGPSEENVTTNDILMLDATKIVDMIYRDSDDQNDFNAKLKEKRKEIAASGNKQLAAAAGLVGVTYLKKFIKQAPKEELTIDLPDEGPTPKKEKIPRTPLEVTTFEETLDALVQMRNTAPDEFISLVKKLGVVDFNGIKLNLPTFTIDDFDNLPEDEHAYVVSLLYNDKDIRGKIYRTLQNFERTAGIKLYSDKDVLPAYHSEEIEPGKFVIEATPWKALPDDVAESFYDVCIYDVIKNSVLKSFSLDFKDFMSAADEKQKIEFRRTVKNILYKLIITNRDEFEGVLDLWYKIHDNPAGKAEFLKKYAVEIDILASTGFNVGATEVDQYFTNMKSAALDVYHLMHGILYSIALSEIHGMILAGELRPNKSAQNFDQNQFNQIIDMMKRLFVKEDKSEFLSFIQKNIPLKIKMLSYMHLFNMTWEEFYGEHQKKIDAAIKEKITNQPTQQGVNTDELTFFEDLVNLTGTIGEDIDTVKDTLLDLLTKEMGTARQGNKIIYSSVQPEIGAMIIRALQIYLDEAPPKHKDAIQYVINSLQKNKQAAGIAISDGKRKNLQEAFKNIIVRLTQNEKI